MKLSVTHETTYQYLHPVHTAQHLAFLHPINSANQRCIQHQLTIDPEPHDVSHSVDAYGNHRTHWSLAQVHDHLCVRSVSEVHTYELEPHECNESWEAVREHFRYRSGHSGDPHSAFVFASHHAPIHPTFASFASNCFEQGSPMVESCVNLMRKIHTELRYESLSTDVHTPALQALEQGHGVCQDFAHIQVACLRSLGLAARYVSGYLLTHPPEGQDRLIGSDASHAWVSVYVPSAREHGCGGWLDLDPTNDRWGWGSPGTDYVHVAVGRDFADVSPLRGVIQGGAQHTLDVAVTVQPIA